MVRSAVGSVLSALVAALKANTTLMALLSATNPIVSGKAPQSRSYPYLRIGDPGEGDVALAFEVLGKEPRFLIHIWSAKVHEMDECIAISDQIELSLNQVTLSLSGQYHLLGSTRLVTIVLDPDGTRMHGIVQYSATVLNAA